MLCRYRPAADSTPTIATSNIIEQSDLKRCSESRHYPTEVLYTHLRHSVLLTQSHSLPGAEGGPTLKAACRACSAILSVTHLRVRLASILRSSYQMRCVVHVIHGLTYHLHQMRRSSTTLPYTIFAQFGLECSHCLGSHRASRLWRASCRLEKALVAQGTERGIYHAVEFM